MSDPHFEMGGRTYRINPLPPTAGLDAPGDLSFDVHFEPDPRRGYLLEVRVKGVTVEEDGTEVVHFEDDAGANGFFLRIPEGHPQYGEAWAIGDLHNVTLKLPLPGGPR